MTGTVRAGGGLLHKPRRRGAAALAVAACLLPHAALAQSSDGAGSMLDDLHGLWAGHGTVNATGNGPTERVDCTLRLDWRGDIGRLGHTLSCHGTGSGVQASGYFDLVSSTNRLTGFVNGSSTIGRARATCELKGRALHITMTQEGHDPRDAFGQDKAKRSLWILLLNRGDRRLGTVIKARDRAGGTYNKLAVTMRRVERRMDKPGRAAETPEATTEPPMRRPVDERTVIER